MITASQLRTGMAIRHEGQTYKVLFADYHPGQGKMGGAAHARLKNLDTGTTWEHSFRSDLKLENLPIEKQPMEFLYSDADSFYFMHPETFDQVAIPAATIGDRAPFLQAGVSFTIELVEDAPVSVLFPDMLEIRVTDTAPPAHAQQDSAWKQAKLENGIEVMVPQFIKNGDTIRLDVENLRYMDRSKGASK